MALHKTKKPASVNLKLTRKQQRKQKRKEKKIRRNEFYTNRKKPGAFVLNPNRESSNQTKQNDSVHRKKEKNVDKRVENVNSNKLIEANVDEDRNIRQLEKQLKLKKRKSKSIPKSFSEDGLDFLLEVCDPETMKNVAASEQELNDVNDEFEEDLALIADTKETDEIHTDDEESDEDMLTDLDLEEDEPDSESEKMDNSNSNDENLSENEELSSSDKKTIKRKTKEKQKKESKTIIEEPSRLKSGPKKETDSTELEHRTTKRRKEIGNNETQKLKKAKTAIEDDEDSALDFSDDLGDSEGGLSGSDEENSDEDASKKNPDRTWEDIYGRLRSKDGSIINNNEGKYIPPAVRAKLESGTDEDKNRIEKLNRLKKQLKGLLNRLAEGNMHSIASQIENLYMNNSRNDMNDTLTKLMMDSLISPVMTPERLLVEHVVLIAVLHANVGTEVGAHFLQTTMKKFDDYLNANHDVENKLIDNTVNVISQLYNFKLFDAKLMYEVLQKLSEKFEEKDIECILHILKSVGFALRKEDPLSLKDLIMRLQKQATNATENVKDNPRVKFMLDVLLAVKNNNVSKIPNYDTSYPDHLKKVMKGFIRKGNYVTQLNISLEDLLKAEERGKWWVVGSAWAGNNVSENNDKPKRVGKSDEFSEKLLALAAKQRMNTDVRRNIFCIIMSAEDYLDAFEKLLRLGLKNQQEREIINVLLHCCLHEKNYNPYYAVLAQKFCEYDRKYQMTIKYSVWDKLKALGNHSGSQISNLAKMLTHLFIEKGLSISTLKVVQFGELDKVNLRFMRQILLGVLLHEEADACLSVFDKVAQSDKLKLFRESLRLFIHHFLLKNLKSESVPEEQRDLLETRAKMVEKALLSKEGKLKF
ncbi:hypothetical protein NQ318_003020 [Aromia moschata]|uniref:MI domain-containing protein n=1 Tax=Aromia moschata TaxID=1265417 RepID=A0AAV8YRR8_9CUCU|nr:hypothetical protein NQ318_003020 [Aromia moschata]